MDAKVRYWTSLSEYDIETAGAMLLTDLSVRQRTLLIELEPLNVEARYPSHKTALLKKLTKRYCTALVGRSTRLTVWIEKRL